MIFPSYITNKQPEEQTTKHFHHTSPSSNQKNKPLITFRNILIPMPDYLWVALIHDRGTNFLNVDSERCWEGRVEDG